ncbi:MAG: hypothetical protein IKI04_01655, partial [Bacilli bacterium]|nr:hypothetical protein [Bacilli bacterium]
MIKELIHKDYLHNTSKTFNEFFIERPKTENEIEKNILLKGSVLSFYNKVYNANKAFVDIRMFDDDMHSYGYIDNYGYYVIRYDSFGYLVVHNHGEDISGAVIELIQSILTKKRMNELSKNKKDIKKEYRKHYKMKYFDIIYHAKYDLDKWNTYFDGNIPERIINIYNEYMNMGLD